MGLIGETSWTDARVARLEILFFEGHSSSTIALVINREFGSTYSRCAIIGKLHRCGLKAQGHEERLANQLRKSYMSVRTGGRVPSRAEPRKKAVQMPKIKLAIDPALALNIAELVMGRCHFPYGDKHPFQYCGRPSLELRSFCEGHCAEVFVGFDTEGKAKPKARALARRAA
jgi:hypothetical protein